jgi:hypothetical protein
VFSQEIFSRAFKLIFSKFFDNLSKELDKNLKESMNLNSVLFIIGRPLSSICPELYFKTFENGICFLRIWI